MLETRRGSRDWNNIKGQRRPLCLVSSIFTRNGSSLVTSLQLGNTPPTESMSGLQPNTPQPLAPSVPPTSQGRLLSVGIEPQTWPLTPSQLERCHQLRCSHPSTISFQRSLIRLLEENKVRRREKVGGQGRNNETSRSQIHWRSPVYDLARQHSLGKKF